MRARRPALDPTAANRKRRQRARERDGVSIADALVETGYLPEWDRDDPAAISRAMSAMVREWAARVNRESETA